LPKTALYEEDFLRWTEVQATNLRRAGEARVNLPLDWTNLAEEVESLGRSQRRELRSRIAVVIEHLLKLERSPAMEPRQGWIETVGRERREIERLLEDSPSLRGELGGLVALEESRTASFVAELLARRGEIDQAACLLGERAAYTAEQILGDWLPGQPAPE
jgi:hypothetical protein